MNLPPIPHNEAKRLIALHGYQILDSQSEEDFNRLAELASVICDVPISLVTLVDENRQWFKSNHGIDFQEIPRSLAFCQYTILQDSVLEIQDASSDDRFKLNPFVTNDPKIRFYAGYPLTDPNGYNLGTFCIFDTKIKALSPHQKRALELLAGQAMSLIVDHRKREELRNFERLFKLSNDLICVAGTDGFFKKINPAFTQVLGWDEKFLLETPFLDLVHEDDIEQTYTELAKLSAGETIINFLQRFRTKSGDYVYLQWVTTPEPGTGNLFAIARNVTDEKIREDKLKVSEDNFRSFFENSQGLMCTHDMKGNFLTVNSAGAALLGYTTEQVLNLGLFDLVPERHHQNLSKYLYAIQKYGKSNGLMTTVHKDGSYRIWSYHNVVAKNQHGEEYVIGNSIDVTESQRLEKSLEKMREMLVQTNQVARVGGWEVDMRKNTVYWSEVTRQIHDVEPDFEPTMQSGLSFYKQGESYKKITDAFAEAISNGTSYELELELITAKGAELWVRSIGNVEFENGECKRVYGTFQDIDEKKRAELEIVASKRRLDDVLNAASEVSIIATDSEGMITVFNKGAEKLLGYDAAEVIGKFAPDVTNVQGEIAAHVLESKELYGDELSDFKLLVYKAEHENSEVKEWTYRTKTGELFPVSLVTTTIRDHQNAVIGYLGVATDLSARKKAEQELTIERARLLAFVEHAPAAVAMLDKEIKYLAVSRKWLEEYRLEGTDIIGLSHYEVFTNLSQEWKDIHQQCLKGEIITNDEELWRPEGWDHDQYLKWEVRPWFQHDGTIGGIMMFTQDITEAAMRREELKHAKLLSEQASIAKSEFLANMSHEIRTPLNGVIGFTDLVLKTKMNDTQKQYLNIVNQSANALLSIINDILDFSKIEAGKLELDAEKSDIYDIAAQSADIISFPIQNKGLEMLLNIPDNLPRFVWVDEIRLKQVLINLLSNAAKFTEYGEIELKIEILSYNPAFSNDITCRFIVRDTGIGIREEKQSKIFEAFLQEDGSTTKKYGGTGLGLTISNKLLGMMGSRLELESIPGIGSTFFFDLALKSEPGEPIIWKNSDSIKKVLIVDDNENNRLILQRMLQLLGIETDQAKNGFEALSILAGEINYDVIVMDYHMPEMDGLETIRKVRAIYPDIENQPKIVLLNSSADDVTVIKACDELDVSYRLMKPIKFNDISLCLSRLSQKESVEENVFTDNIEEASLGVIRVLIAEDNPVNMFLAKTIIAKIAPNAEIWEAENGIEAVEFCKKQFPDIVFMDVQMPEMNGYEATIAIRKLKDPGRLPIIALTAGNVKGERDKCLEAGMDDFIAKPFVEDSIRQIFNRFPVLQSNDAPKLEHGEIDKNVTSHFDQGKLLSVYMNDQEFIAEFLVLIKDAMNDNLEVLKQQYSVSDLAGIKATGHKLKGSAASAFLYELAEISGRLEHLTSFDSAYIRQLIVEMENEIAFLIPILNKIENPSIG